MPLHPTSETCVRQMESQGHRITGSRLAVVEAVSHKESPFTAEEICADLPGVGRATVYRSIKLLQAMGVLCRVLMEDGSPRYQPSHQSHHHHLVCVRCGSVRDFVDCDITDTLAEQVRRSGFEVLGHRLEVFGRCRECGQAASAN